MNPVLVILIIIGAVLLWLVLRPFFAKIGEKEISKWTNMLADDNSDDPDSDEGDE